METVRQKMRNGFDIREEIGIIIRTILQEEGWGQDVLADKVGVKQPTICRWLNGASIPRRQYEAKLFELHAQAIAHHWDFNRFVPICAFADSYPETLHEQVLQSLKEVLNANPLKPSSDNSLVNLHILAASLPKGVDAFTFANDSEFPTTFIVLVNKNFSLSEQHQIGWKEANTHVANYSYRKINGEKSNPLSYLPSVISRYPAK